MQKFTNAFINHCLNDMGYSIEDITVSDYGAISKIKNMGSIVVAEKTEWSYETFEQDIQPLKKTDSPCFVLTDGNRFLHIFVKDLNGNYREESDVPAKSKLNVIDDEALIAEDLHSRNVHFTMGIRGNLRVPEMGDYFLLALQIDRNQSWGAFRATLGNDQALKSFIDETVKNCPLDTININSAFGSQFYENLLLFEDFSLSQYPHIVAAEYVNTFTDRYDICLKPELAENLLSFVSGKTDMVVADPSNILLKLRTKGIESCTVQSFSPIGSKLRFILGDKNDYVRSWNINGTFDTIIAIPPFGVIDREPLNYTSVLGSKSRDLASRIIEESMLHLTKAGKLVAIVPSKFLFSGQDATLRAKLMTEYNVSFIQILKGALEPASGIETAIIIIENSEPQKLLTTTKIISAGEFRADSSGFTEYSVSKKVKEGYFEVENSLLEESWVPMRMYMDTTKKEDPENDILLSEVTTVISGVSIPSSEYIKSDSFGGIPYVRVSDYSAEGINLEKAVRVPGKYTKVLAKKGDILFSITATIGKMAVVGDEIFVPGAQSVLLRPKEGFRTESILKALCSDEVAIQISCMITGATIHHISRANVEKIRLDRRGLI